RSGNGVGVENPAAKELARRPARLGAKRQLRTRIRKGGRWRLRAGRHVRVVHRTFLPLRAQLVSRFGILESSRICRCHCPRTFSLLLGTDDPLWWRTLVGHPWIPSSVTDRTGV